MKEGAKWRRKDTKTFDNVFLAAYMPSVLTQPAIARHGHSPLPPVFASMWLRLPRIGDLPARHGFDRLGAVHKSLR